MLKKAASVFGLKLFTAIVNLLIVILISQAMGAAGKGECSLIITSVALILIFCNFVGGATLVYMVPRNQPFKLIVISYAWTLLVCFLSWLLLLNSKLLPSHFILPTVLIALLSSFLSTNLNMLLGKERSVSNTLISFIQSIFTLILLLVFIQFFQLNNPLAYIQSLYFALTICIFIALFLLLPYFDSFDLSGSSTIGKELLKIGTANQLGHITQFISLRLSYYLLAEYNGEAQVGVYSNGVSLAESIWLISNSIALVQYGRIANSTDEEYKKQITVKLAKVSTVVCLLAIGVLIALPSSFFVALFGSEFSGVADVILVLSPGILFYNLFLIFGHYFSGNGNYKMNLYANISGLIVTLLLSLLILPDYGILKAGLISSISYIATSLVIIYLFMKETKYKVLQLLPSGNDFKNLWSDLKAKASNRN